MQVFETLFGRVDEDGRISEISCYMRYTITALPESLGKCAGLKSLVVHTCKRLTSLPESLGQCLCLQELNLASCESLTSLPDLSGLPNPLNITFLPEHLKPWKASGFKAFTVTA